MSEMISRMTTGEYEYGKENLSTLEIAKAKYASALRANPDNSQAKFGSALANIMLAAQDKKLSDLINKTFDARSPFDGQVVEKAAEMIPIVMKKAAELAETYPEFHEIQDALAESLLPAMDNALLSLTEVYADPSFSMMVAIDGRIREIDHAEAGVVLAGVKALRGLLTLFLSYDIDIDKNGSYDYFDNLDAINGLEDLDHLTAQQKEALVHVTTLMAPGSTFLAVRPEWKVRLGAVKSEIDGAVGIARASLASIKTETDTQIDDLLRLCNQGQIRDECIETEDLNQALDVLDSVTKYMKQPYRMELSDLDTTVIVDFTAQLNIQDVKKMLPYYDFYPQSQWDSQHPVFYFKNASGKVTGDLNDIESIDSAYHEGVINIAEMIDALKNIIYFQDPTFQGLLPGATEASIWALIQKEAEYSDSEVIYSEPEYVFNGLPLGKRTALKTMSPRFSFKLIRN